MKTRFTIITVSVFLLLSILFYVLKIYAPAYQFITLECGNVLMALLSLIAFLIVMKQKEGRPQAFVNSVSGASFLKLMVCMIAILVYVLLNRSHIHKPTVFVLMGIYFIYSIIENSILSLSLRK